MTLKNSPFVVTAENLQIWAENSAKTAKSSLIVLCIISMIPIGMMLLFAHITISWDQKISTWDKVEGTILKNTTRRVRSGRSTKTVSDIQYKYRYRNVDLTGNKITYSKSRFPSHIKPGNRHTIIVNPANPSDSAALIEYKPQAWFLKYLDIICFGILALILWSTFFINLRKVRVEIPEKLYQYLKETDEEKIAQLCDESNNLELRPFCNFLLPGIHYPRADYFYIKVGNSKALKIVMGLIFLQFMISAIIVPFMLPVALGILCIIFALRDSKIIFDLETKRIIRSRKLHPVKIKDKHKCDFDTIKYFIVKKIIASNKKGGEMLTLFAVTNENQAFPITKVSTKKVNLMLSMLAEVLPAIGKYPVIFK